MCTMTDGGHLGFCAPTTTDQSALAVLRRRFRTINNLLKCICLEVHK